MYRYLITSLLSASIISADETAITDKSLTIEEKKRRLPALEILPEGSILKDIRIPRYNADYTNASLLTAEKLEVISNDEIQGTNVCISLYDKAGKGKTETTLNAVNFNQRTGLITSRENLTFYADTFSASSQGIALDWEKHCGFLLGKNQTIIYIKESNPMINSKVPSETTPTATSTSSTLPSAKKNVAVASAAAAATLATFPAMLSAQDMAKIDELAQPSTENFIQQLDQTKEHLKATAEAEAKIEVIRKDLHDQLGNPPKIAANQPPLAELVPIAGRDFIKITSDHLLFDAKQGLFVYSGDVKITHPKYAFTCDGELKIVLNEAVVAEALTADEKAELKPNARFDDIKYIIATKNVVVQAKDNKGKPVTATTPNLTFNKTTGDIILRGKNSRVTTADAQLKVNTTDGYIRLDQDMNASGVGTTTNFVLPAETKKP